MAKPSGVHLVGSSGLPDTTTFITKPIGSLPGRLKRIPDGETGERHYFTLFQMSFFASVPEMQVEFKDNAPLAAKDFSSEEVEAGIAKLKAANPRTGYEDAAIESYAIFRQLREKGKVGKGVKFQVCLPTMASVVAAFVQRDSQAAAEPV